MSVEQIKNIETLIPVDPGKTIVSHEVKRLTAPGENYGSLMLSVDLTVKTQNGTEKIHTVAKMVPPNEFIQEIFNTQVTFRNEIAFYENIVPVLQNFQRENGVTKVIDFAAKCYGGRLNLNDDDDGKVDENAALVLENLKIRDFLTLERTEGLDLEPSRLVLKNLAHLHAVPLALKLRKPDVFNKNIKPYLETWEPTEKMLESLKKDLTKLIEAIPEIHMFKERALKGFDRMFEKHETREPFATIAHNDCWTCNNMFRFEDTKPVESKLVDFQIYNYGSPARDIIFFIFSSVKDNIIKENYDELLIEYHQVFVSTLKELKCDTTPFTFDALQKELDFEAKYSQFGHIAFMLGGIYMTHDQTRDISELSMETMSEVKPSDKHKQKLIFVLKEFAKRNWI